MESNDARRELERAVDRAEAAPWTDFPATPVWYPPAVGLWSGAVALAIVALPDLLGALALLVLVGVEVAFVRWYRVFRGSMPTGLPPVEMRRPALLFALALLAIVVLVGVLVAFGPGWAGPAVAVVLTTALVWTYERAYAAGAARARRRLA